MDIISIGEMMLNELFLFKVTPEKASSCSRKQWLHQCVHDVRRPLVLTWVIGLVGHAIKIRRTGK